MTSRKTLKTTPAVSGDANVAITGERLRISAILESAEGKRNPAMAQKLALYSALDVETAKNILAEAPAANPYLAAADRECPVGLNAATADFTNDPKAARLQEIKELGEIMRAENRRARGLPPKKD